MFAENLQTGIAGAEHYKSLRLQMVNHRLRSGGISDERVLAAMARVPRHEFIPNDWRPYAYEDHPLPIGFHQTISQPFIVAVMCQAAQLQGSERVLEVGAGSGYGAAVLGELAREVHTVERIPILAAGAKRTLERLGYENVYVHVADGCLGWPSAAPYEAIVVTAGAESLPDAYIEQLELNGRIVMPIGGTPYDQTMYRVTKSSNKLIYETLGGCAFVPLIRQHNRKWGHRPKPE